MTALLMTVVADLHSPRVRNVLWQPYGAPCSPGLFLCLGLMVREFSPVPTNKNLQYYVCPYKLEYKFRIKRNMYAKSNALHRAIPIIMEWYRA